MRKSDTPRVEADRCKGFKGISAGPRDQKFMAREALWPAPDLLCTGSPADPSPRPRVQAHIQIDGKANYLGTFDSAEDAARAW